jgi:hypothetical protein
MIFEPGSTGEITGRDSKDAPCTSALLLRRNHSTTYILSAALKPHLSVMKRTVLFSFLLLAIIALPLAASATYIAPTTPTPTPTLARIDRPVHVIPITTAVPTGAITISSIPSGAQVIIDGAVQGTTPFTIRTLTVGSHTLLLTKAGYQDYPAGFTIAADQLNQQTYTLIPITTMTPVTTTPVTFRTVVPKTTTPAPTLQLPQNELWSQLRFTGPVSARPISIQVGNHTKMPRLTTMSPYFSWQLNGTGTAGTGGLYAIDVVSMPITYIEVDSHNVYLPGSHLMSSAEMALDPVWGDEDTVLITIADKHFNNTNFRWLTAEKDATAFYQVSRFPFDSNASHWQNQYVPGLVASGPAKEIHVDSEGFHYFTLDFAPIANHNAGDPPFYTGLAHLDTTVPGKGTAMGIARIPWTGLAIYTRKFKLGPVSIPVPASIDSIPPGELTEQDLGNPNENMILSSTQDTGYISSVVGTALLDYPTTYYVRVVPIHKDGTAGIPALPVTVTVVRPHPCPPTPHGDTTTDVVVRPPSAQVVSFYMTSFVPDWIHTDQNGNLVARARFVTVTPPPYCDGQKQQDPMYGSLYSQLCSNYGGGRAGYHFYADPAEEHWYDTVWGIITGLFSAFAAVIHAVSSAWNEIQNAAIEVAAFAIKAATLGGFDCSSSEVCKDVLRTGLSIAESSLGIPPTIPDVADLESMGTDYMAKVAAEELGVGGVLDTAKGVYDNLPDTAKQGIKNNAGEVGTTIAGSLSSQTGAATASAAGNWYIPDPLYYQAHPAIAVVKVYNPNDVTSDPVNMAIRDSAGLYRASGTVYIPRLKPHDSTIIPVVLQEDYTKVYTSECRSDFYTSECGGGICIPCYWNLWIFRAEDISRNGGGDTFVAALWTTKDGYYGIGLNPGSSGTVLRDWNVITFDEQGKSCGSYNAKTYLKYPGNWQMQKSDLKENLESLMWLKYQFTEGDHGKLIGG